MMRNDCVTVTVRGVLLPSYAVCLEKCKVTYEHAMAIISKKMLGDIVENAMWTIWWSNSAKE